MIAPLIDLLKHAPSPGNLQPWVLWVDQQPQSVTIRIQLDYRHQYADEATDHCGSGALAAIGTLAYSIEYLCGDFGYKVTEKSYVASDNIYQNQIVMHLAPISVQHSNRPDIFKQRFTDRRPYEARPISPEIKFSLVSEFRDNLRVFNHDDHLHRLTDIFKALSLIRYTDPVMFSELSAELNTDRLKTTGIPIDYLGLSVFLSGLLKLQKHFPLNLPTRSAYAWPMYESITKPFKQSAEIWCIKMNGKEPLDWIQLGEKLMRIWLEFTEAGIRMHPFGNTLTIYNYFQDPSFFKFTPDQIKTLEDTHHQLLTQFEIDSMQACLFFRLGYSRLPRQVSARKNIEAHFTSTRGLGIDELTSDGRQNLNE